MNLFDFIPLKGSVNDLPEPDVPHFLLAREGMYLRKRTIFGNVLLKQKTMPTHLQEIGKDLEDGCFWFEPKRKLPRHLINAAWGFFKEVYERDKTEAEVLILFDITRNRFRLFVPYQVVSGGSVESIYDPADLPSGYDVVGSIHSHCDFGAFHSGTDSADASSFNGLHVTLGHVNDEQPDIAAMVSVNGTSFEYRNPSVVAQTDDLKPIKPPKRWFNYIGTVQEISKIEFKTLTADIIADWVRSFRPVVIKSRKPQVTEGKYFDAAHPWWENSEYKSTVSTYYQENRYCQETKSYVPREWFDSKGKLREAYLVQAFERAVEELFKRAQERDVLIAYEVSKFDEPVRVEESNALLPGPFAVIDPDREKEIEARQREFSVYEWD